MRFQPKTLLATALLLALAASPALAKNNNISGDDNNGNNGNVQAAPGPVAGAGLGYLLLAGGYYAVRRWRKQNTGE